MITAIIADDEDLPRKDLRRMLAEHWPELKIVAECEHGADALEAIHASAPDIAFLDIRMPGMSGLDVAHAVKGIPGVWSLIQGEGAKQSIKNGSRSKTGFCH